VPGSRKTSNAPVSLIQWVPAPPWPAASPADTSMNVSAELNQKAPTVRSLACAMTSGMDPYSAIGTSRSYSNTSRLYSRYLREREVGA